MNYLFSFWANHRTAAAWAAVGLFVVIPGAALRLARPDLSEFKLDQLRAIELGVELRHNQWIAGEGMGTSLGIPNPPGYVYLMGVLTSITTDPASMGVAFAAWNTAGLVLAVLLYRRLGLEWPGTFVSAALYSFGPMAVVYGRSIWQQNALPTWSILFWLCLVTACRRGPAWLIPAGMIAGFMVHIHYSALFWFSAIGLWMIGLWRHFAFKWIAAMAVAFVVMNIPTLAAIARAPGSGQTLRAFLMPTQHFESFSQLFSVTIQTLPGWLAGSAYYGEQDDLGRAAWGVRVLANVWAAGLWGIGLIGVMRRGGAQDAGGAQPRIGDVMLLPWLTAGLFCLSGVEPHEHYFTVCTPILWLGAGLGADMLGRCVRHTTGRIFLAAAASAAAIGLAAESIALLRLVDRQGGLAGDYGISLGMKQTAADRLAHLVSASSRAGEDRMVWIDAEPEVRFLAARRLRDRIVAAPDAKHCQANLWRMRFYRVDDRFIPHARQIDAGPSSGAADAALDFR